jgi:phosphopantothenoylcysteine decarboxylase/phosphopantothenate--cysteine ligase
VVLVSGPTNLEPPPGSLVEQVRTAEEMAQAVFRHLEPATVVLMVAAVADFRPAHVHSGKIKKADGHPVIKLEPTRDILAEIVRRPRPGRLVVGFAAESSQVLENAAAKMREKRLDLIAANDVTQEGAGFDADTNIVSLIFPTGEIKPLEKMSKFEVANRILDEVVELRRSGPRDKTPRAVRK